MATFTTYPANQYHRLTQGNSYLLLMIAPAELRQVNRELCAQWSTLARVQRNPRQHRIERDCLQILRASKNATRYSQDTACKRLLTLGVDPLVVQYLRTRDESILARLEQRA